MKRNAHMFWFLVFVIAGLGGCSSKPPATESKKTGAALEKIQGMAQVMKPANATDAALNAGGPSIYIWEGIRRYRLFLRTEVKVDAGKEYVVEGIHAQKVIDEIGDPDQGKNGYPLESSCARVVNMAWTGLGFYEADEHASALRQMVNRYPARPVFLVTQLSPAESTEAKSDAKDTSEKNVPEVTVPAEKQRALLTEGPTALNAPLWQPTGGTARCKVLINTEGKISELQTGAQLCEAVPWSQFSFKPTVQGGRPVRVKTEVEVRFDPRK